MTMSEWSAEAWRTSRPHCFLMRRSKLVSAAAPPVMMMPAPKSVILRPAVVIWLMILAAISPARGCTISLMSRADLSVVSPDSRSIIATPLERLLSSALSWVIFMAAQRSMVMLFPPMGSVATCSITPPLYIATVVVSAPQSARRHPRWRSSLVISILQRATMRET